MGRYEDAIEPTPRPDPGFDVIIKLHGDPGDRTFVSPRLAAALQDVYDTAVSSMDFGSGFLDTEEVENLRILGRAIGAKPLHYNCEGFYNGGGQKGGYSVTRSDPWPNGPMKSVMLPTKDCTCGAESRQNPSVDVVDGEVVITIEP